ncbi:MAG: hypothetical protein JSW52_11605 [Candidatus Coatesbacteria bacterium]|nr:MAG: hypothetical protein JSW52_11605 [Candidatus Coatesbacteria bacterium]
MKSKLHILITGRHLEKCHVARLYGVHPAAINQIAGVRPGDRAYLFSKVKGRVYGPYDVAGDPTYLPLEGEPPIWEREQETGRERFRVVFRVEPRAEPASAPVESLYELARDLDVAFFPEDVINRSVFTFLPADRPRILTAVGELPWQETILPEADPVDITGGKTLDCAGLEELAANEKVGESFVEYVLARGDRLGGILGDGGVVWNQLRVPSERSRIDLVYKSGSTLYIIELKSGAAGRAARRELMRYAVWAKANRTFLGRQFGGGTPLYVQPTLIGASCPGPTDTDNLLITYALTSTSDVELRRLN